MAIGFEFATSIKVGPAKPEAHFEKSARLSRGSGWTMVVDGDDVEFVLAPVEETDLGRSTLELNIDGLIKFVTQLQAELGKSHGTRAPGTVFKRDLPSLFPNAPDFVLTLNPATQPIGCIPQVTAGVRLGRLRKLFRILADPTTAAAEQFLGGGGSEARDFYAKRLGKAAVDYKTKDPKWADHAPSAKMRGLVSLIALYLVQGNSDNAVGAVKYLTFVMSRTRFSALFNELPDAERDHYRSKPEDWVALLCTTTMTEAIGAALNADGPVIGQKVTDRGNLKGEKRVSIPITRRSWLTGMTRGQDLLSAAANPIEGDGKRREYVAIYKDSNPGLGHRLRGLAALGDKMDDVTYGTVPEKAAIVEFRARQVAVLLGDWKKYALESFDFFRMVNEGDRFAAVDLPGAPDAS
jgi:hypothetical protein